MTYSIIDSVKGGSGKTCFSLHLCMKKYLDVWKKEKEIFDNKKDESQTAQTFDEEIASQKARPLYVDMDIMGSSIESILWGSKFVGFNSIYGNVSGMSSYVENHSGMDILPYKNSDIAYPKRASRYLNDIVEGQYLTEDLISNLEFGIGVPNDSESISMHTNKTGEIIQNDDTHTGEEIGKAQVDMIISDPSFIVKSKFRGNSDNASEINVGEFRYQLYKLLKKLNNSSSVSYNDIIFDMPPGGDRYSECLYDILLKKETYSIFEDHIDVYHMTTLDNSHMDATIERVVHFYNSRVHVFANRIKNIYIILNNTINAKPDVIEKRLKRLIDNLEKAVISQEIKSKIRIIDFPFAENYRQVVCGLLTGLNPNFHTNDKNCNFSRMIIADMLKDDKIYKYDLGKDTWEK